VAALIRTAWRGEGDLLSLLPAAAYRMRVGKLGYSRRTILIVNDPEIVRTIMTDPTDIYPKNDLMVGALEPLVGDSIFVSSGDTWRRQREMIDPAFSHMRINEAFASMRGAVDDYQDHLDGLAESGETFSLDLAMSHLTADVICRTVFSTSLQSQTARDVFEAFTVFERSVAHVELRRLIFEPAWSNVRQHDEVLSACNRIRRHLGELLDTHLDTDRHSDPRKPDDASGMSCPYSDIASAVIDARDRRTGEGFSREELIDQLGVFFLAGHETTASVLTWAFFILATQWEVLARMREEIDSLVGDGEIEFEHIKRLPYVRNVFKETLRLYPPITFIPRVAAEDTQVGRFRIRRGAMIMVSPWTIHRHRDLWENPHAFDPDRFSPERQQSLVSGAYLPFGQGPRVCVGKAFATVEATLILSRLVRRFEFEPLDAHRVRPAARLTTRPAEQIMCRVRRRS
jgi:cytochrome P450